MLVQLNLTDGRKVTGHMVRYAFGISLYNSSRAARRKIYESYKEEEIESIEEIPVAHGLAEMALESARRLERKGLI